MATLTSQRFTLEQVAEAVQSAGLQELTEAAWPAFEAEAAKLIGKRMDYYLTASKGLHHKGPAAILGFEQRAPNRTLKAGFDLYYQLDELKYCIFSEFSQPGRTVQFAFLKENSVAVGVCLKLRGDYDIFVLKK